MGGIAHCVKLSDFDLHLSEHLQLDVVQVGGGLPGGWHAGLGTWWRRVVCPGRAMAVRSGDYGPVLILAGEHQGEVGYYDDDEGEAAVVYLGEPFVSDYVLIPRDDLDKVDARSLHLERWKRAYPWLVKYVGVP